MQLVSPVVTNLRYMPVFSMLCELNFGSAPIVFSIFDSLPSWLRSRCI